MFLSGGAGIWSGLAPPSEDLLNKPRAPPPRPLPLDFPNYVPECKPRLLSRRRLAALRQSVLSLRRPTDNNEAVIRALNLHLTPDVTLHDFVPADFLPQRPYVYDEDLEAMLAELRVDNDDAFREVLRQKPKEGHTKPRIAYSRNFYGNLEDMSRYTDSSNDDYFDATDDETDDDGDSQMSNPDSTSPKKTKPMYQGHRLGNAAQLPAATRAAAARNLLKMVIHKFNCRDYDISSKERLRIKDINLPPGLSMYNCMVGKIPHDRSLARARIVEGPVLAVSTRRECVFDDELYKDLTVTRERNEIGDCLGSQVDLLRETGSALAIALQRHREGKQREKEHQRLTSQWWWAQKPRWGGGETKWGMLASEVFEDEDPSWSPKERKLQYEKREKAEAETKRIDEVARGAGSSNSTDGLSVADLIAKGEEAASSTSGRLSPTVGLLSEKNSTKLPKLTPTENATALSREAGDAGSGSGLGESDGKRPKKKNRLTIPVTDSAPPESPSSPALDSSTTSPTAPNLANKTSALLGRQQPSSTGTTNRREERDRAAEFKDGRRLMYTAPMRRKWFKEWGRVRPNASSWDERVIWRRVGAPVPVSSQQQTAQNGTEKGPGEKMDVSKRNEAASLTSDIEGTSNSEGAELVEQEPEKEEFDEVYQVSCLNHHVALLKMRVSRRYLRWLETGHPGSHADAGAKGDADSLKDHATTTKSEAKVAHIANGSTSAVESAESGNSVISTTGQSTASTAQSTDETSTNPINRPEDARHATASPQTQRQKPPQCRRRQVTESDILQLQRSRYYDLFSVAERTEFFQALWRLMCWLLRDEVPVKGELERVRALSLRE